MTASRNLTRSRRWWLPALSLVLISAAAAISPSVASAEDGEPTPPTESVSAALEAFIPDGPGETPGAVVGTAGTLRVTLTPDPEETAITSWPTSGSLDLTGPGGVQIPLELDFDDAVGTAAFTPSVSGDYTAALTLNDGSASLIAPDPELGFSVDKGSDSVTITPPTPGIVGDTWAPPHETSAGRELGHTIAPASANVCQDDPDDDTRIAFTSSGVCTVTLTDADSANYTTTGLGPHQIQVRKAVDLTLSTTTGNPQIGEPKVLTVTTTERGGSAAVKGTATIKLGNTTLASLNITGNGSGTHSWTPATAGAAVLKATFIPTTNTTYANAESQALNLTVDPKSDSVDATPPSPALVGQTWTPPAETHDERALGYTIDPASDGVCQPDPDDDTKIAFTSSGVCTVTLTDADSANYTTTGLGPHQIQVRKPVTVTLTPPTDDPQVGQETDLTVAVTDPEAGDPITGDVTFYLDTVELGARTLDGNGAATLPWTPTSAGAAEVTAHFTPSGSASDTYAAAESEALVISVEKGSDSVTTTPPTPGIVGQTWAPPVETDDHRPLGYTIASASANVCQGDPDDDTKIAFTSSGVCTVTFTDADSANYTTTGLGPHDIQVRTPVTLTLTAPPGNPQVGEESELTITATQGDSDTPVDGTATLTLTTDQGTTTLDTIPLGTTGTNTHRWTPGTAGPATLKATFTPTTPPEDTYLDAESQPLDLTVDKGADSVTATPPSTGIVGQTWTPPHETAAGRELGHAIDPASDGVCQPDPDDTTAIAFTGVGVCTVTLTDADSANYTTTGLGPHDIQVRKPVTVTLTPPTTPQDPIVVGEARTLTAKVTETGSTTPVVGSVNLTLDSTDLGSVDSDANGVVTLTWTPLAAAAGIGDLRAHFTPSAAAATTYAGGKSPPISITVYSARTQLTLVEPPAPGLVEEPWTIDAEASSAQQPTWTTQDPGACQVTPVLGGSEKLAFHDPAQTCVLVASVAADGHAFAPLTKSFEFDIRRKVYLTLTAAPTNSTVAHNTLVKVVARNSDDALIPGSGRMIEGTFTSPSSPAFGAWFGSGSALNVLPTSLAGIRVSAEFKPADQALYAQAAAHLDLDIGRGAQEIAFATTAPTEPKVFSTWTPGATGGGSGEPVQPSIAAASTNVCSVSNGVVSFDHVGACKVNFDQDADSAELYLPGHRSVTITVTPRKVNLQFTASAGSAVGRRTTLGVVASGPQGPVAGTATFTLTAGADQQTEVPALDPATLTVPGSGEGTTRFVPLHATEHQVALTFTPASPDYAPNDRSLQLPVAKGTETLAPPTNLDTSYPVLRSITPDVSGVRPGDKRARPRVLAPEPGEEPPDAEPVVSPCDVSGYTLLFVRQGTCTVVWELPESDDWNYAVTPEVEFTVQKTSPDTTLSVADESEQPTLPRRYVDRVLGTGESTVKTQLGTVNNAFIAGTLSLLVTHDGVTNELGTPRRVAAGETDWDGTLSASLPLDEAGQYTVEARFEPDDTDAYEVSTQSSILTAERRPQTLSVIDSGASYVPILPATAPWVGAEVQMRYRSTSLEPLVYKAVDADVCTVRGTDVELLSASVPCQLEVRAPESRAWAAYPATGSQGGIEIPGQLNPSRTTIDLPPVIQAGDPVQVTALATSVTRPDQPVLNGSYQLLVGTGQGAPTAEGDPVIVTDGQSARLPWTPLRATTYQVRVHFTPAPVIPLGDAPSDGPTAAPLPVTVGKAGATVTASINGPTVTAVVTGPATLATPTGTVDFSALGLGSRQVPLDASGRATWTPAGLDPAVLTKVQVAYLDDSGNLRDVDTDVTRQPPTLTVQASSPLAPRNGWYTTPVTATFNCSAGSAALTTGCPAPVLLTRDGQGQAPRATITALDGGTATATLPAVKIDRTNPTLRIAGPSAGSWYRGSAPKASCVGSDATSGLASCRLTTTRLSALVYRVSAVALDAAGNRSATSFTYQVRTSWVAGAPLAGTAFKVRRGKQIRVMVQTGGSQPQLMLPKRPGKRPTRPGPPMVATSIEEGVTTWVAKYRVPKKFKKGKVLRLGIKARKTKLQVVRIRLR